MVKLDEHGNIDFEHLDFLLHKHPMALVSLMHANNEIGNLLDIEAVGELCQQHKAYFHSDTVQTVGHYVHDLRKIKVMAWLHAAHKFHGPKGVGFMFIRKDKKIQSFLHGGPQERNMRGGTENVYGIIGLAKALEIAYQNLDEHKKYITGLKARMIGKLKGYHTRSRISWKLCQSGQKFIHGTKCLSSRIRSEQHACFSILTCTEFQHPVEALVPAAQRMVHTF